MRILKQNIWVNFYFPHWNCFIIFLILFFRSEKGLRPKEFAQKLDCNNKCQPGIPDPPSFLDAIPQCFQVVFETNYHAGKDCKICQKVGSNSTELPSVLSKPWKRNFLLSFIKLSIRLMLFASSCFRQSGKPCFSHV